MENRKIPLSIPTISAEVGLNIQQCVSENWLSQGNFNKEFENSFASHLGMPFASACSNGTAALWLALKAVGVSEGDEVIVPTFTFSATASAVVAAGGIPVFVDSRPSDGNLSPEAVARAITSRTKAIIPVDLYGIAAPYRELIEIAKKNNLAIIEDAAEALGGSYDGKPLGTLGDIGCFSFFPNKVMTTGEGGMCVTRSEDLNKSIYVYKNHGNSPDRSYWPEVPAFNMRMTNVQAAIGVAQVQHLSEYLNARFEVFEEYLRLFNNVSLIETLPFTERNYGPWMFTVRTRGKPKEEIVKFLAEKNIESRPGFYPLHLTPAFISYAKGESFPVAEKLASETVNLPTFVGLPKEDIARVVDSVCEAMKK